MFARLRYALVHLVAVREMNDLPATPNGIPKPTPTHRQLIGFSLWRGGLPIKPQYLIANHFVNGLKGRFDRGPSG